MARLPRLAVAGLPHLVIQRGRGPGAVFADDDDRRSYLSALEVASDAGDIAIHAYAILNHEVCLLATPSDGTALGRFMQHVGRCFVAAFNLRHGRHGALWADRFQSTVLDAQHHALAAIRFIEQAPMRAGLVTKAQDWPWSSAAHHAGLQRSALVTEHPAYWQLGNTPFEREARHATQLQKLLEPDQVTEFVSAARGGWPLGSTAFIATLARHTDRPLHRQPRGRPRRSERAEVDH